VEFWRSFSPLGLCYVARRWSEGGLAISRSTTEQSRRQAEHVNY